MALQTQRNHGYIALTCVTHVYLNQGNAETLFELLRSYASYPADLLDQIQFIVVDDGTPLDYALPKDLDLNLLLLKITKDIPWNQGGARNLGVLYARSDKVLLTDVDHAFPEETLRYCIRCRVSPKAMYRFWRRHSYDKELTRAHGNTYLLSRGRFLGLFGYDEEFSGNYGAEDELFWRWQRVHGTRVMTMPRRYIALMRGVDRVKGYHSLERDRSHNNRIGDQKRRLIKLHGRHGPSHSRQFLAFPWVVQEDRQRPTVAHLKHNRWWARLWWWRQVTSS